MPEFTEAELTAIWHVLPTDAKGDLATAIAKLDAWKRALRQERQAAEQDGWETVDS